MRFLRPSIAPILLILLAIPQVADARGGGGGGGFNGGGVHAGNGRPGPVGHQQVARFFPNQRFANNLQNGWPAWWGGWSWGYDWPDHGYEYGYQPVRQTQDPPSLPQVIVIHSDGNGRMTTAEVAPDYGYVQGCHAIPNGYHCDTATPTR
jgi:hypothetical protein